MKICVLVSEPSPGAPDSSLDLPLHWDVVDGPLCEIILRQDPPLEILNANPLHSDRVSLDPPVCLV